MKTNKDFRINEPDSDNLQRGTKLAPIRKSGKERHSLYSGLHNDDDDDEVNFHVSKRESVLDYYDDEV
jgi:hypothetical protein